jgi:TonB family protein
MAEVWTQWEGRVINGLFPLRRFLGRSDHSVVFLTEYKTQDVHDAAIKLMPADPALAEAQLLRWRTVAALSHPHLIRLLDAGRCQLGGHQFLFVVMEYAEETLAQILRHRALTPDEVREMLLPALDVLAFLHRMNLVQGQLKPANVLAVDDKLKLASDTVQPAGGSTAGVVKSSLYDPPEARAGRFSAAGDIWGLGMTIVEALTQRPAARVDERAESVSLPPTLPPEFATTLRRCLSSNPANRPTINDLETQIVTPAPQASLVPGSQPAIHERAYGTTATRSRRSPGTRLFVRAIAASVLVLVVVWAGIGMFQSHSTYRQSASGTSQPSSQQAAAPAVTTQNPKTDITAPSSVLHKEIPTVPRSARKSIHGRIRITVRVTVDGAGNVVAETLQSPRPSKYFARLASEAARKWKFTPADNHNSRVWRLRFEFTRGGTTGDVDASPRFP